MAPVVHNPPPAATAAAAERAQRDQALFDQIAEHYCRKDLKPASRRARRHRLLQSLAAVPLPAQPRLLEAGCGCGFAVQYLDGRFAHYLGIDYSEQLIAFARENNRHPAAAFAVADITQYTPPEPVDVVFMIGVLHHMPDPAAAVRHLRSWLRPGGWLVANEPQPGNPLVQLARRVRKRVDDTYSDEQDELSADQLAATLRAAGLTDVRTVPQGLFSTPFAEVVMPLQPVATLAAHVACAVDTACERLFRPLLYRLSWNLVAVGQHQPTEA